MTSGHDPPALGMLMICKLDNQLLRDEINEPT